MERDQKRRNQGENHRPGRPKAAIGDEEKGRRRKSLKGIKEREIRHVIVQLKEEKRTKEEKGHVSDQWKEKERVKEDRRSRPRGEKKDGKIRQEQGKKKQMDDSNEMVKKGGRRTKNNASDKPQMRERGGRKERQRTTETKQRVDAAAHPSRTGDHRHREGGWCMNMKPSKRRGEDIDRRNRKMRTTSVDE